MAFPDTLIQIIRARAAGFCEYSRLPEALVEDRFHIDHIRAIQHRGLTIPENLAQPNVGRTTIITLDMNDPDRIALRQILWAAGFLFLQPET